MSYSAKWEAVKAARRARRAADPQVQARAAARAARDKAKPAQGAA